MKWVKADLLAGSWHLSVWVMSLPVSDPELTWTLMNFSSLFFSVFSL